MHILMVSDVYFPRVNGVSTSIQAFRQALQAAGHSVTLIAPDYGQAATDEDGIIRISSRGVIVDPEDRMMRIRHIHRLADELQAEHYDIIHIHTPFVAHYAGLKLARKLKLPVVATYHTFFEEYLYNYIPWLPKEWLRYVARRFSRTQCAELDGLIVPSTAMQQVLLDYGVQTPMTILPTGLDMRTFEPGNGAAFRAQHAIAPERPVLLFVGRVAFEKNIGFLLDMMLHLREQLPDVLLVIAGEGPAEKTLHQQVQRAGLAEQVLFVGYLRRDGELQACYKAADVFVFASRTETQGLVLLEAMACGTPVVSTAVLGTKDIIGTGVGGLVAPESPELFAAQVKRLLTGKTLHAQKTREALAYAATWSHTAQAEKLVEFYRSVMELKQVSA
ncbi:MAG TPA: glycosyltransferase [Candidatus Thiothrix moscowensis]|uniref:glycosyltransferase n=1 Tax=unclassified Thiothrix TaxID=2636184 RepID=UPI0025D185A4|nr:MULTISPECIES: glycosyltransferase [unclassified Thiothrix]HRJ52964.1 glycosyltransferase [Candidatus Thiothrix moscowensis]HRJ92992.1 glycosyltransferase [Candidatus Thiothrix moscowensis]